MYVHRFPFNWKDPFFYALAMAVEYLVTMDLFYFISCLTTLKIGTLLYTITITEDIKRSVHSINTNGRLKKNVQIFTELTNFVQFHLEARQLSTAQEVKSIIYDKFTKFPFFRLVYDLSDIFQPLYVVMFSWSISEISGSLLLIQYEVSFQF